MSSQSGNRRREPRPGRIYSRSDLLERHVSTRRLASDEFEHIFTGHYALTDPQVPLSLRVAYLQNVLVPDSLAIAETAAELLRCPLPFHLEFTHTGTIHICQGPRSTWRGGSGIKIRRTARTRQEVWDVRPAVCQFVDILCDLAPKLSHPELVACIDHLVGLRAPRRPTERDGPRGLDRLVQECEGPRTVRKGIADVRKALADAREQTESSQETYLRLALVALGFPEPTINHPIPRPGLAMPYRLDLSYPELRVAIEYDGPEHQQDPDRYDADHGKDDYLHHLGWRVIRVKKSDMKDPSLLIARLVEAGVPGGSVSEEDERMLETIHDAARGGTDPEPEDAGFQEAPFDIEDR
jgi:hypothetical protein